MNSIFKKKNALAENEVKFSNGNRKNRKIVAHRGNYTPVPHEIITANLSHTEILIWIYLFSVPDYKKIKISTVANNLNITRKTAMKAINQMLKKELIRKEKFKNSFCFSANIHFLGLDDNDE